MSGGRIVLLITSPRVGPGLLSWPAWEAIRAADLVLAADPEPGWRDALAEAGVEITDVGEAPAAQRAGRLVEEGVAGAQVVWLSSPDGDPGLTDALAEHLSRHAVMGMPPEVEVITGSHDVPGARLLDLVAVMDRLRSPGGCPWDAEQTHTSLLAYLLEETHEVIEAVHADDRDSLSEELGDLLLQVVFHARLAEEDPQAPFDIDDVAAGIVAKMVRRHPHVFAGADAGSAEAVAASWEELKAAERPDRALGDGIPLTLPALARAQKLLAELGRAGEPVSAAADAAAGGDPVVGALLAAVLDAQQRGEDAETLLRAAVTRLAGLRREQPVPPSRGG